MSKHSKWAKIKRQKGVNDVKRGQLFSKLSRMITIVAKEGGRNPESNFRLRMAMDQALAENMPKENIERAIEKAASGDGGAGEALILDGHGPGKTAVAISVLTDNRNRTVSELRKILSDHGGSMGDAGSTAWNFERKGFLYFESVAEPEALELAAIDAEAEDVEADEHGVIVRVAPEKMSAAKEALEKNGYMPARAEITLSPKSTIELSERDKEHLEKLVEALDAHEDVTDIAVNAE